MLSFGVHSKIIDTDMLLRCSAPWFGWYAQMTTQCFEYCGKCHMIVFMTVTATKSMQHKIVYNNLTCDVNIASEEFLHLSSHKISGRTV